MTTCIAISLHSHDLYVSKSHEIQFELKLLKEYAHKNIG